MESNTFATTIYARTPADQALAYLRRLQNLDEWTLGSRMVTRIDDADPVDVAAVLVAPGIDVARREHEHGILLEPLAVAIAALPLDREDPRVLERADVVAQHRLVARRRAHERVVVEARAHAAAERPLVEVR